MKAKSTSLKATKMRSSTKMAIAKPYEFPTFDDSNDLAQSHTTREADQQSDPVIDIEAIKAAAREEALAEACSMETSEQTRILEKISISLENSNANERACLAKLAQQYCDSARMIASSLSNSAAIAKQAETAIQLIERHGRDLIDVRHGVIGVSAQTSAATIKKIKSALNKKCEETQFTVKTDPELAHGDISLTWDNGSITANQRSLDEQLQEIFAQPEMFNTNQSKKEAQQ